MTCPTERDRGLSADGLSPKIFGFIWFISCFIWFISGLFGLSPKIFVTNECLFLMMQVLRGKSHKRYLCKLQMKRKYHRWLCHWDSFLDVLLPKWPNKNEKLIRKISAARKKETERSKGLAHQAYTISWTDPPYVYVLSAPLGDIVTLSCIQRADQRAEQIEILR